jgi:ketol-acid reductoisomerase
MLVQYHVDTDADLTAPDDGQGDLCRENPGPTLRPDAAIGFANGLSIHFDLINRAQISTCSSSRRKASARR